MGTKKAIHRTIKRHSKRKGSLKERRKYYRKGTREWQKLSAQIATLRKRIAFQKSFWEGYTGRKYGQKRKRRGPFPKRLGPHGLGGRVVRTGGVARWQGRRATKADYAKWKSYVTVRGGRRVRRVRFVASWPPPPHRAGGFYAPVKAPRKRSWKTHHGKPRARK